MATTLQREDILKAAQEMSKEERLRLIAEIAALPEESPETATVSATVENELDQEVLKAARQFMDKYSNLLSRLAE